MEFLSTLTEREKTESMRFPIREELEVLSKYLGLENDRKGLMNIRYYYLGSLHTLEFLRLYQQSGK